MYLQHYLFVLVIIYFSIVIGIAIKFYMLGLKGKILSTSIIFPLLYISLVLSLPIDEYKKNREKRFQQRIALILELIIVSIRFFPVFVGLFGRKLKQEESNIFKNITHTKKIIPDFLMNFSNAKV